MVYLDYPLWRTIIFPFYSLIEVIYVIILVVITYIVARGFDFPPPIIQYLIVAYIGAALANRGSTPAHIQRCPEDRAIIQDFLHYNGLSYDEVKDAWIPPLPNWLLWNHTNVELRHQGDNLFIRGPYAFLKLLFRHLQER